MPTPTTPPPMRSGPPRPIGAPTVQQAAATTFDLTPRKRGKSPKKALLYAVEGWGKTTFGVLCEKPIILMGRNEKGYATLLDAGLAPSCPAIDCDDWQTTLGALAAVETGKHDRETLVVDAIGSFERLCQEHVCTRDYGGDWGERGFASYAKGYDLTATEWLKLISSLDRIAARGMNIVMLGHARAKTFKNPMGADYDRYSCDTHEKVWSATARFFDAVLFGTYVTVVDTDARNRNKNAAEAKGKGVGGAMRVLYCDRRDAFDAKNRFGMPEQLDIPNDPAAAQALVWSYLNREIQQ